jgi:hypothetical protein
MEPRLRIIFGALIALCAVAVAVLMLVKKANLPGESRQEELISGFLSCVPEETSDTGREEVRGIMTRFYNRAAEGRIHPRDVVEIEEDLEAYIASGAISKEELFDFMTKVGNATRRMDGGYQRPTD